MLGTALFIAMPATMLRADACYTETCGEGDGQAALCCRAMEHHTVAYYDHRSGQLQTNSSSDPT